MSVLVIFGSNSDNQIYDPIMAKLKENKIKAKLRVLSAHRTPKELENLVKKSRDKVIITGAGLSAALPGVVAATTIKPVLGVPCLNAYQGLDAFLSVHQMPPGIPVLGTGVNDFDGVVSNTKKILEKKTKIGIRLWSTSSTLTSIVEKATNVLDAFKIKYDVVGIEDGVDKKSVYIDFLEFPQLKEIPKRENDTLKIFVPVAKPSLPEQAIYLMDHVTSGLWVGLGRGENAALGAVEILNISGKYSNKIKKYRKDRQKKVLEADKAEQKRWR